MKKVAIYFFALSLAFMPLAPAHAKLTPDCGQWVTKTDSKGKELPTVNGKPQQKIKVCEFEDAMVLINTLINFLLFVIVTPLIVLILCYAGWLFLSSGGSSESRTKAKRIFKNVIIGYIIALLAWFIVHTIFKTLGFTGETYLKDY